jgi:hypothetical protein
MDASFYLIFRAFDLERFGFGYKMYTTDHQSMILFGHTDLLTV